MNLKERNRRGGKYVLATLLASLALYPVFFRLNVLESNYEFFDITCMVSPLAWVYLSIMCFLLSLHMLLEQKCDLVHVMVATLLVYGLYSISQYPTVINRDVWVHGRSVKQLIVYGATQLGGDYPKWWPGAFTLCAVSSITSGIDVVNASFILVGVLMILSSTLLYLLGRETVGHQWAGLVPILYYVSDAHVFRWMGRDHYSPHSLGFALCLLVLYSILRMIRTNSSRAVSATLVVVVGSIVVSHPFSSFSLALSLLGIFALGKTGRIKLGVSASLLWSALIMWFAWWMYNSPFTFEEVVRTFDFAVYGFLEPIKLYGFASVTQEPLTWYGRILRDLYFKPLLLVVTSLSILVMFVEHRTKKVSFLTGVFLGSTLVSFVSLMTPTGTYFTQFSQVLMVFLLPTCCIASRLFVNQRVASSGTLIMIPLLLVPSFLTMFTYSCEYAEMTHTWEIAGFGFCSSHFSDTRSVGTDSLTEAAYRFFDLAHTPGAGAAYLDQMNLTNRIESHPIFFDGNVIMRSLRQELTYDRIHTTFGKRCDLWNMVDVNLASDRSYNRICDNSYLQLYGALSVGC